MLHLWTNIFRSLSGELNRGLKASFNLHSLNFLKLKKAICVNQNTLVDMRLQASSIGCLANRFFVGLDQRKSAQGNTSSYKPTQDQCK